VNKKLRPLIAFIITNFHVWISFYISDIIFEPYESYWYSVPYVFTCVVVFLVLVFMTIHLAEETVDDEEG
jgi:hypothetical protein